MMSDDRYLVMQEEMISDLQIHTNGLPYAFAFDLWNSKFGNPALVHSMIINLEINNKITCNFERVELNRG